MREDDLKSTFEQLRAAPMPVRGLTADDIIGVGEAVRKRRRTMAVVGSGVGTTVIVAVAVLALALKPGDVPNSPVEPAGPSSTTSVRQPVEGSPSVTPLPQTPIESSTEQEPPATTTDSPTSVPSRSVPLASTPSTTTTTTNTQSTPMGSVAATSSG